MSPAPQAEVMLRNAGTIAIKLNRNDRSAVKAASHHGEFRARVDVESVKAPIE